MAENPGGRANGPGLGRLVGVDMAEGTQPEDTRTIPHAVGWCHWHKGLGEDIRLIQALEQGSGRGASFFACPRCRDRFNLVPLADRP